MRFNKVDIIAPECITAIGSRVEPLTSTWEVYAKLTNGSEMLFGVGGTQSEADKLLQVVLEYAMLTGQAFRQSTEGDYVNLFNVVRYYVDGQASEYIAMIEDRCGRSWPIRTGRKRDCVKEIKQLAEVVSVLEVERRNGNAFQG